jgi:hypothetical protein
MNALRSLGLALAGCLAAALLAPCAPARPAEKDDKDEDLVSLSMEIAALQMLHDLKATPEQLEALAKLLKDTSGKMPDHKTPKVSDKMRKLHQQLRDAYVSGDDDKIGDVSADLEDLKDSEKLELEDEFELTDAARKKAAEMLARFTPRQAVGYLVQFAEEFPDPLEKLTDALEESRTATGQDWEDRRDETAGQVGWLVGGLDKDAEAKVREKAIALLDKAHKLKDADYKGQKKDLEKEARELTASAAPPDVVRHFLLHTVGELLSNPRATAAVEGRLKKAK